MIPLRNLLSLLPAELETEQIHEVLRHRSIRIERILSKGHTAPASGWYDQDENEWVVVLQGSGRILFEDGTERHLQPGDYLDIPAHSRHRVVWTDPDQITIWLAVFYS